MLLPELQETIFQVLTTHEGLPWSKTFSNLLLQNETQLIVPPNIDPAQLILPPVPDTIPSRKYPTSPLYKEIAIRLLHWVKHGKSPVREADEVVAFSQLQDADAINETVAQLEAATTVALIDMQKNWQYQDHRRVYVRSIFRQLKVRGVQRLLFMRRTIGSCYLLDCQDGIISIKTPYETEKTIQTNNSLLEASLSTSSENDDYSDNTTSNGNNSSTKSWSSADHPVYTLPPLNTLISSFNTLHSPVDKISVGARALAKHSPRDETRGWWGVSTGTTPAKNLHAMVILSKILSDATWINMHMLPHEVKL